MTTLGRPNTASQANAQRAADLLRQYGCGGIPFTDGEAGLYDRHVVFDNVVARERAEGRERFEAFARSVRDILAQRWICTGDTYEREGAKRVYYLSMEYLLGRSLSNNVTNLMLDPLVPHFVDQKGIDWLALLEEEPDAGLGNGGLGRLAACFLDSMATMGIPSVGYGLRYEYGMFRQSIEGGWQVECPDNWLRRPDPWEVARPQAAVRVPFGCSFEMRSGALTVVRGRPSALVGIPFDRPVIGFGGRNVNTLRLWSAAAPHAFDFREFSSGDFVGALTGNLAAESTTRVLYPDDSTMAGQALRFVQEYFLVACSIADIVRRFARGQALDKVQWSSLPERAAIQMNDTHPTLAVPELMRVMLDEAHLSWEAAWDVTTRTLAYTNHTLLPEALERWPVAFFEAFVPRHLELIYEINRRFLDDVRKRHPGDDDRVRRVSLVEEGPTRRIRMAHLAIVGSHSTNGVAAIHSELLRTRTVRDLAELFPERFNNKTNGVTPRRWLHVANPWLSKAIVGAIGTDWITDLAQLSRLKPLATDGSFRTEVRQAKRAAKVAFAEWLLRRTGLSADPDTVFDCQVKRIHEYKRQLLNVIRIAALYGRIRENPSIDMQPRTFLFAGKAAPAYRLAKLIIKLVNSLATLIDNDPIVKGRMKVLFLPDYSVTLAERLIPAADVSNQISTAGYEASGTSNMKFMMNGALTLGTRDGATIEMAEEAGEANVFLFGLTAEEVEGSRGWYSPWWHYNHERETQSALRLLFSDEVSRDEPNVFAPLHNALLEQGDRYMHLADLRSYLDADARLMALHATPNEWARVATLNIASSGKFSSDRSIADYAREIWNAKPCPVR